MEILGATMAAAGAEPSDVAEVKEVHLNRTGNGNNHDGLECYYCGNRGDISTGCNVRLNKVLLM